MAAKRIFYLTANGLSAFYCDKDDVTELGCFDITPEGIEAFGRHLQQAPDFPSAFLVDVIEEEFRSETVPHLIGSDRRKLLARKMATLFRTTPFRSATLVGREHSAARRDQVLFTALTKPESIEPWLDELRRHKVPLVGIYSLATLTQLLAKKLNIKYPNALVLTIQQGRLLRQSFLNNGDLKISRLSPLCADNSNDCLATILHEVDRNQRYLGRLQLLTFRKPMDVIIIAGNEILGQLSEGCQDTEQLRYHFIDINDAAGKIGLNHRVSADQCEACFAWSLSRRSPASNYAPKEERTYYSFFKARKLMVAASVILAMVATLWSVTRIYEGQQYKLRAAQVEADTRQMKTEYEEAMARLPALPYQARVMRAAVESDRQLALHKPKSLDALSMIGTSLAIHSNIHLDEIQWHVDADDASEEAFSERVGNHEVATIKAHLKQFPRNYQTAFKQIEHFMDSLKSIERIEAVEALSLPLEINPANSLTGESQRFGDVPAANFTLRMRLKNAG